MRQADPAVERLRTLAPFVGCTELELRFIARRSSLHRATPGSILTREGVSGREFGVILEGVAVVRRGNLELTRLGRGDVFGEIAVLDHGARTATVLAATELVAVICHEREFREIIEECPTVAHRLLVGLAQRFRSLDGDPAVPPASGG